MAHTIADQILDFDKASREDVIFNTLKNGLGDDYWVFHSLSVNQTSTNGVFYEKEIDFVVYHREKGILFIEAKNGADISYYGGEWRYSGGRPMAHRGPFKQVQPERITVCNLQRIGSSRVSMLLSAEPQFASYAIADGLKRAFTRFVK